MLGKNLQKGEDHAKLVQITKQAMLSAANKALVHKARNPKLTDNEVLNYIMENLDKILAEVKEEN